MNPVIQNLYDRKSIRAYTDRPVSAEDKAILFEAAMQAPTGGNQQGFTIIDVTDQAIKDQLAELCDHQPFIATAPVVLVFIADSQKWNDAYREAGITPDKPGLLGIVSGVSNTCIVAQNVRVTSAISSKTAKKSGNFSSFRSTVYRPPCSASATPQSSRRRAKSPSGSQGNTWSAKTNIRR